MKKWAVKKEYGNTLSVWRYIDDEIDANMSSEHLKEMRDWFIKNKE